MLFHLRYIFTVLFFLLLYTTVTAQKSYTLQQTLQVARTNNLSLKAEQYNIHIAESDIVTAKLRPNPNISNETIQLLRSSEFAGNTSWYNHYNRQTIWQISKPIQIAGQRKNKIEVADKNLTLAEKEFRDTERRLFLDVSEKWLAVWTTQKQLDMLSSAKENIESLLSNNQYRYKNQVITQTDLFRTELLSKQYNIQYKAIVQELDNRKKELAFLMGIQDDIAIDTTENPGTDISDDLENMIMQALKSRSDILASQQIIEVTNSNIKLQKSLAYPIPELGLIWNPQNHIPYFGISFSVDMPFFDRNQGAIKKSHLQKYQAEQQLFAVENRLQTEIKTAYNSYLLHQRNSVDFKSVLEQSQVILDNVKYAYLRGGTTIIDFLEAQRAWLETQEQYYETLQLYRQSYIQLLYATGLINQLAE